MYRLKTIMALLMAASLIFPITPWKMDRARADVSNNFNPKIYVDGTEISQGQKGVDYGAGSISIEYDSSFVLNGGRSIGEIKIFANGRYDETDKFDVLLSPGRITFNLKQIPGQPAPVRLRPISLYSIYIPYGLFKNSSGVTNPAVNFYFVTKGEQNQTDILITTIPAKGAKVYQDLSAVILEFADDISIDTQDLRNRISITAVPLDPSMNLTGAAFLNDFDIYAENSKLVLKAKNGSALRNFSQYTISIQSGAVKLKNSGGTVYNGGITLDFTTYNMLSSTYPESGKQGVEVEPTIKFTFRYPVEILNRDNITVKSGEEQYSLDKSKIYLSSEGKTLNIDINDDPNPLRRSTPYTVRLGAGCVRFRDYNNITNDDMVLNFTTSGEGQRPEISGFSSSPYGGDDITSLSGTRLSGDGSIYIRFDRNIKWDREKDKLNLQDMVKLYKIPKPLETAYDPSGRLYDSVVEYVYGQGIPGVNPDESQRVPVSRINIVNGNTLEVKPGFSLMNINRYRLFIDKRIVEDSYGYNPEKDIIFYFWTAPAAGSSAVHWMGISSSRIYGAPAYSDSNPIVLNTDGEVIFKAGDTAAFNRIVLSEGYNTGAGVNIERVRLEYYFENGVKKTRIKIFPEHQLQWGKLYKLSIGEDVFESRQGVFLSAMNMEFVVQGNAAESCGIYSISSSSLNVLDIYNGGASFTIRGYNFTEDVEKVELLPVAGNAAGGPALTIGKQDLEFENVTEITVKLRDSGVVNSLGRDSGSGTYAVRLYFTGENNPVENDGVRLEISPRGKPVVKSTYPGDDGAWYNEKELSPRYINGVERFFLKVTFSDVDGSLAFDETGGLDLLRTSTLYSQGQNEISMIDTEFLNYIYNIQDETLKKSYISNYIFVKNSSTKEAYLYIPVKPLKSQTTYTVMINAGIVYYGGQDEISSGNDVITWSFTTMAVPVVTGVESGSVAENYDEDVPIILKGNYFNDSDVKVYFNDIKARKVKTDTAEDGSPVLKVYLPSGSDRLEPGIYTVKIVNDDDHEYQIYGALSVVKEGRSKPQEDYVLKYQGRLGDVRGSFEKSEDTFMLDRDYTDKSHLELDLDELMGPDVLVRKIRFRGSEKDKIEILDILSKWADISLYNVTLDPLAKSRDVEIILGRVEPSISQKLKSGLGIGRVKSDLIRVTGENFKVTGIKVVIPFKESNGDNLKALRYDEDLRTWQEEYFTVNKPDGTVNITSQHPGIFAVVEGGKTR